MYKGVIKNEAQIANVAIPFVTVFNDGNGTNIEADGKPELLIAGKAYEVDVTLNATGVASGNVSAQLYADNEPIEEAVATGTFTGTSDYVNLAFHDIVRTKQAESGYATLSVKLSTGCTVSGLFTVK